MKINLVFKNILVVALIAFGLTGLRIISEGIVNININTMILFVTYFVFSFIPIALLFVLKRKAFIYVLIASIIIIIVYLVYGKVTYELPNELLVRLFFFNTISVFSFIGSIVYVVNGLKVKQINLIFIIYLITNFYMIFETVRSII